MTRTRFNFMWLKFALWLVKTMLASLGERADAESNRQLKEYEEKKRLLEAFERDAEVEIGKIETNIGQIAATRKMNAAELSRINSENEILDAQIKRAREVRNEKIDAIRRLDDDAVLRGELF